ncbi:hypothetical protein ACROYT_G013922 [Oculina patagonica]
MMRLQFLGLACPYTSYTLKFEIYTGKRLTKSNSGLGYDVVMNPMDDLFQQEYHLFVDNFYSSPQLFKDLHDKGCLATGTEFIGTLHVDEQMVRQLCVRALSRGVGSMEYVDSLLIMEDGEHDESGNANAFSEDTAGPSQAQQTVLTAGSGGSQQPRPPSEPTPSWCKCQQCQPMAQEVENRCCGYKNCTTNK